MKFSHTEARSAVLRPTTSKTACLNLFPLILPNLLRLYWNQNSCHQENETLINKRAVCRSDMKHNKDSGTKTLKHQTDRNSLPVRDETCNALENFCVWMFTVGRLTRKNILLLPANERVYLKE